MPLLYDLAVAERRREVLDSDEAESIHEFRAALAEWAAREADEERQFEPDALWELVVRRMDFRWFSRPAFPDRPAPGIGRLMVPPDSRTTASS